MPGAVAFGVIDHSAEPAQVMYLEQTAPVDEALLALAAPLDPREVFRFAAPCQTDQCTHWSGHDCQLVHRITRLVPAASLVTPPCTIRSTCRWFSQAGRSACFRCPTVVTKDERPTEAMREAAAPSGAARVEPGEASGGPCRQTP